VRGILCLPSVVTIEPEPSTPAAMFSIETYNFMYVPYFPLTYLLCQKMRQESSRIRRGEFMILWTSLSLVIVQDLTQVLLFWLVGLSVDPDLPLKPFPNLVLFNI